MGRIPSIHLIEKIEKKKEKLAAGHPQCVCHLLWGPSLVLPEADVGAGTSGLGPGHPGPGLGELGGGEGISEAEGLGLNLNHPLPSCMTSGLAPPPALCLGLLLSTLRVAPSSGRPFTRVALCLPKAPGTAPAWLRVPQRGR